MQIYFTHLHDKHILYFSVMEKSNLDTLLTGPGWCIKVLYIAGFRIGKIGEKACLVTLPGYFCEFFGTRYDVFKVGIRVINKGRKFFGSVAQKEDLFTFQRFREAIRIQNKGGRCSRRPRKLNTQDLLLTIPLPS